MNHIEHPAAQRSPGWVAARLGQITMSEIGTLLKGRADARERYLMRLVGERLTGQPEASAPTEAMLRGVALEDEAIAAYEWATGQTVQRTGYLAHRTLAAGGSPDGLVGDDGIVEIKTRAPGLLVAWHLTGAATRDYMPQVQGLLWITGRRWCDLVGYCRGLPLRLERLERDEAMIAEIEAAVSGAHAALLEAERRMRELPWHSTV